MSSKGLRRPKDFEKLIESLVRKGDGEREEAPFETYANLMVFAAVVGARFCEENFCDNFKTYGEPIRCDILRQKIQIIDILAACKKNDLNVLTDDDDGKEKNMIFEGYAYAGLKKINSIVGRSGFALENLINFVQKNMENEGGHPKGEEVDLSSLISD